MAVCYSYSAPLCPRALNLKMADVKAELSSERLETEIRDILKGTSLQELTKKKVRQQLKERLGFSVRHLKKTIGTLVEQLVRESAEKPQSSDSDDGEEELDKSPPAKRPRKKRKCATTKRKPAKKKAKTDLKKVPKLPWGPTNFCSEDMAVVCGVSTEDELTRPQVVKKLWDYIKSNELQNPDKRTEILCDDALKRIFEDREMVTAFSMMKYLSAHLTRTGNSIKRITGNNGPKKPRKKMSEAAKLKRAASMPVYELSSKLKKVCCEKKLRRTEVVKRLWAYIKENDLQNPENKREILCDKKLKAVFGKDAVGMFEMNKFLSAHLTRV